MSEAELVIRRLYSITNQFELGFAGQLRELLDLGRERFQLDLGIVSRIEGQVYRVVESRGGAVSPGDEFALEQTYCQITMQASEPIGIPHMERSKYSAHPCYRATQLEAYVGAPIVTPEGTFGTLNFSSSQPKERDFQQVDLDALQLMASWIGGELRRRALQETVSHIHGLIPICSSCKSIRSELGNWQAVEKYFRDQADLDFSHGICPTCAVELYGHTAPRDSATTPRSKNRS